MIKFLFAMLTKMEKLIKLLNEYKPYWYYKFDKDGLSCEAYDMYEVGTDLIELQIISKKFGFIKRLVENDKINFDKAYLENCCMCGGLIRYGEANGLIMKLSISSSPIEDLISYLK